MSDYIYHNGMIYSEDELKHYGVIGMKWGMRRAAKRGETYTYKSHGQKKWERKLNKRVAKGKSKYQINRAKKKLDRYKQRDENRQRYAEQTTGVKGVAKQMLMGTMGAGSYNRYRAAGNGRLASYAKTKLGQKYLGSVGSVVLSKGREMKTAKKQLRKKRKESR